MQSTPTMLHPSQLEGFESVAANAETSTSRRQRISMACQYCRHRKIRCCGGAPCRNCTRSSRECDYSPVPEEVNKATREKKATAKLAKSAIIASSAKFGTPSPLSSYSPYIQDAPTFDSPFMPSPLQQSSTNIPSSAPVFRPVHLGHRRTSSTPAYQGVNWTPSAPMLSSPAMMENSEWMYNNWSAGPAVPNVIETQPTPVMQQTASMPMPAVQMPLTPITPITIAPTATPSSKSYKAFPFPSVLEQTPMHDAYLASQQLQSVVSQSTPVIYAPPHHHQQQQQLPVTPPESRSGSIEADYPMYSTPLPPANQGQLMPAQYIKPMNLDFKNLTINTQAANQYYQNQQYLPHSPPLTPSSSYYTPYGSNLNTPSLYSAQSSNGLFTPSPPSISPTLAPEMISGKPEPLLGLGIGMNGGGSINTFTAPGPQMNAPTMGMNIPMMDQDVFYTPQFPAPEEYFLQPVM